MDGKNMDGNDMSANGRSANGRSTNDVDAAAAGTHPSSRGPSAQRAASWSRMCADLAVAPGPQVAELRSRLETAWAQPQRRYHTLQHLDECLALFESVRDLAGHPGEVAAALWFHDAVYEVKRHDNEARSADWAREALFALGAGTAAVERVVALIDVTRHAALPGPGDQQLLVDIDLSILGTTPERFAEYEMQVRDEYAFVSDADFRRGRMAILRAFLERPRLYGTERIFVRFEAAARRNLHSSLARLG